MKTEDKIGAEIKVGSTVLFAKCGRSNTGLFFGSIEEIKKSPYFSVSSQKNDLVYILKIKCHETNTINKREAKDVLNVQCYKEKYPEYFI